MSAPWSGTLSGRSHSPPLKWLPPTPGGLRPTFERVASAPWSYASLYPPLRLPVSSTSSTDSDTTSLSLSPPRSRAFSWAFVSGPPGPS